MAKEVKKELTAKAINIRLDIKSDLRMIDYLLRTYAATDFSMAQLLKSKIIIDQIKNYFF